MQLIRHFDSLSAVFDQFSTQCFFCIRLLYKRYFVPREPILVALCCFSQSDAVPGRSVCWVFAWVRATFENAAESSTNQHHTHNVNINIMSFFSKLRQRVDAIDSLLCVGLDPHTSELPEATAAAAQQFCVNLIEQTHAVAAAYKPNSAFFEAFGAEGITALHNVIKAVPAGIPVLLDAKRGDISTTAAAYAVSAFDKLDVHSITLAPYMGVDSIDPFIRGRPERGCFVLCKTSNPSANDFQTLSVSSSSGTSRLLFEEVALKCQEWNSEDNVGLVVGATDVEVQPFALHRTRLHFCPDDTVHLIAK